MLDTQLTALAGSLQMLRGDLTELATACDAGSGDATCEQIRTVRDQLQLSINISEPVSCGAEPMDDVRTYIHMCCAIVEVVMLFTHTVSPVVLRNPMQLNTLVQIRDMTSSLLAQLDAAIATVSSCLHLYQRSILYWFP